MSEPINVLSLGAGVQSSTLALMAARNQITPMPKAAVFADTKGEPEEVYEWLNWLEGQLPYPVIRVTAGDLAESCLVVRRSKKSGKIYTDNTIPAFSLSPGGHKGLFGRRCTYNHKIEPIVRAYRKLLGLQFVRSKVPLVRQWIGISTDEAHRMKPHKQKWIENVYPLIDRNMSRQDCLDWMRTNKFPTPPRSACIFCPFHSDEEWLRLSPEQFEKAAQFEENLQRAVAKSEVTTGVPYLHEQCIPLRKVKFQKRKPGYTQISLFGNECEGMCGV